MNNIKKKIIGDLKYDIIEVAPNDFEPADKRVWQIVYVYRKGKLIAEGRAACCMADIRDKLYDMEQGYEIATGRARIAIERKKSYGHLPGGYYKGAYYGPTFSVRIPRPSHLSYSPAVPLYCFACGQKISVPLPGSAYWSSQKAIRKCARHL